MRDRFFISSIIAMIFLAMAAVFLYAQALIEGKFTPGYTLLSFPNAQHILDPYDASLFTVELMNKDTTEHTYTINFMVDDQVIATESRTLEAGSNTSVEAPEKVIGLANLLSKASLRYTVTVSWESGQQSIYKQITLGSSE